MKTIYTILFFISTSILIAFVYLFLTMMDKQANFVYLLGLLIGIALSILALIYLLNNYLKLAQKEDVDKLQ